MLSHVEIAPAMELNDSPLAPGEVAGELLVVDRARGWNVQDPPARIAHPPLEVDLLRVDEEGGIQVVDLLSGLATDEHRARLHPVDLAGALTAALRHESPMQK